MNEQLQQIRLDALVAKTLHNMMKKKISFQRTIFTILSVSLPILVTGMLYLAKGTSFQNIADITSFIFSIGVIIYAVIMLSLNIDEKYFLHRHNAGKNIDVANEAILLIQRSENTQEIIDWFCRYVTQQDENDNDLLSGISEEKRKEAYRNALKEFTPGNHLIVCPVCNKSPWKFEKGNCQLCGNTKE